MLFAFLGMSVCFVLMIEFENRTLVMQPIINMFCIMYIIILITIIIIIIIMLIDNYYYVFENILILLLTKMSSLIYPFHGQPIINTFSFSWLYKSMYRRRKRNGALA